MEFGDLKQKFDLGVNVQTLDTVETMKKDLRDMGETIHSIHDEGQFLSLMV